MFSKKHLLYILLYISHTFHSSSLYIYTCKFKSCINYDCTLQGVKNVVRFCHVHNKSLENSGTFGGWTCQRRKSSIDTD